MIDRAAFGRRLRREREQRGISLDAIAQSTKIKRSLLDALERGDVSHWPAGIFGRGFLRAYLNAIDLPTEPFVAEFQRLGSASSMPAGATRTAETRDIDGLRLTLEPTADSSRAVAERLVVAVSEGSLVLAAAALIAWLTGAGFWIVGTVMASLSSVVATLWLSRSPALWVARRLRSRIRAGEPLEDELPDTSANPKFAG